MEPHRKLAIKIIDIFENLLNKYNIVLPNDDREGNEEEASIYGSDYYDLEDQITDVLDKFAATKNVKSNIYDNSKFELCNNHSFEEIKEGNMEGLDYEKAHDLASLEIKSYSISAYLGVYNGEFTLTYSIHDKNNFYDILENSYAETIDMKNISNVKELEKLMKDKLADYFINNREYIEEYSKELSETENVVSSEDEEELP